MVPIDELPKEKDPIANLHFVSYSRQNLKNPLTETVWLRTEFSSDCPVDS